MLGDRVLERTTTTGTGDIALAGAQYGHLAFSQEFGAGAWVYYVIVDGPASQWEIGYCQYNANTLVRSAATVLRSSNADAKVDFGLGIKDVFCSLPSKRYIYLNRNSILAADVKTDRWLNVTYNTLFGWGNCSAGSLQHAAGNEGWFNTAFGSNCMVNLSTGYFNTALGYECLKVVSTGYNNVGLGFKALYTLSGGASNSAIGSYSLYLVTSGTHNMGVGYGAIQNVATGSYNVGIGSYTCNVTTGSSNIGIGYQTIDAATNSGNIGIGYRAGRVITSGNYNICLGYQAEVPTATSDNQLCIGRLLYGKNLATAGVSTGSLGLGTYSWPGGGGGRLLVFGASTGDPTNPVADTCGLYNISGELWAFDENGNYTLNSPHAKDAPPSVYANVPGVENVSCTRNPYRGVIQWINHDTEPCRHAMETYEEYNKRRGLQLGDKGFLARSDWDQDETERVEDQKAKLIEYRRAVEKYFALPRALRGSAPTPPDLSPSRYTARPNPFRRT